jgi:hypothetical protein
MLYTVSLLLYRRQCLILIILIICREAGLLCPAPCRAQLYTMFKISNTLAAYWFGQTNQVVGGGGGEPPYTCTDFKQRDSKKVNDVVFVPTLIKKKTKFSSYVRKFRWDRVQSQT